MSFFADPAELDPWLERDHLSILEQIRYDFTVLNESVVAQVDLKVMDQIEVRIVNHIAEHQDTYARAVAAYRNQLDPSLGSATKPCRFSDDEHYRAWLDPKYWED